MTDDAPLPPLSFAEVIEILRCRPTGYAGTELVDDLVDDLATTSIERYPQYPMDDHLFDAMRSVELAVFLAGPGGRDPDDDGFGGPRRGPRIRPLAPAGVPA